MAHRGSDPLNSALIYDALFDDEVFDALPDLLATSLGARSATMFWRHNDGACDIMTHSGYFTAAQFAEYAVNYAEDDPWARAALPEERQNRTLNLDDVVSDRVLVSTSFYNDWIRGMGDDTFHCMGSSVTSRHGVGIIGIHRGKGGERFDGGEVERLQVMMPDLRRLMSLKGQLQAGRHRAAQAQGLLDSIAMRMIVVQKDGRLITANRHGQDLLDVGRLLRVEDGRIIATGSAAAKFQAAIARATCPTHPTATNVSVAGEAGRAGVLTIVPHRDENGRRLALVLAPLPKDDRAMARRLDQLFDLTPTEARIAIMIGSGTPLRAVAAQRGTAYETARAQMKAIASKLQCERQADVIILLQTLMSAPAFE